MKGCFSVLLPTSPRGSGLPSGLYVVHLPKLRILHITVNIQLVYVGPISHVDYYILVLSVCLFVCLSVCLFVCLSVCRDRAYTITSIHLPRSRTAVLQRTSVRFSMAGRF